MRTKALLGLAALAASAFIANAQTPVYSLNVVGYVNKSFSKDLFVLVCNPLNNPTNSLKTMIANPPDNTIVFRWSVGAQDLDPNISTYSSSQAKWIPEATINPGEGFFVVGSQNFTNTFVGEVMQGNLTNTIAGGGATFQAIGSMVPVGGSLTNVLAQYPATDNDIVFTWLTSAQDFDPNLSTYNASQGKWVPDANIPVGDGFFILRSGPTVNYVRNFTVQ